jgi:hypothetical protein
MKVKGKKKDCQKVAAFLNTSQIIILQRVQRPGSGYSVAFELRLKLQQWYQ